MTAKVERRWSWEEIRIPPVSLDQAMRVYEQMTEEERRNVFESMYRSFRT